VPRERRTLAPHSVCSDCDLERLRGRNGDRARPAVLWRIESGYHARRTSMTKGRGGATEMFEMLAVLHLHAPPSPGQRGEPTAQIGQVLSGLQRMCKEEWSDFLRFAELQRVYLRTLQLLEKWAAADAVVPRFEGLQDLAQIEQRQGEGALAALHQIVPGLASQGKRKAEPQPQSWGDRLAHKWNFRIPGLPRLVEIHVGCLGQTGEQ